jgi:phospholipase/carboxylesterase
VPQLELPKTLPVRFIFPHAPVIPVTINGGYPMPAWFDITALTPELKIDEKGLRAAIKAAHDLIAVEINRGIPPARIVLAGFSQGGAMALSAALTYPDALAGIVALSTFIPPAELAYISKHRPPIYMAHGNMDDVVPMPLGERTRSLLEQQGFEVWWNVYTMGHEVCKNEIDSISKWLQECLVAVQTQ